MVNEETARYADIFAALGSEPRLEIMRSLFAAYPEGMTVGEIQEKLKIPNSTLSHHLEKLRIEGLVNSRKEKQFLWYSANAETMEDLLTFLSTGRTKSELLGIRGDTASGLQDEPTNQTVTNTSRKDEFMFGKFFESISENFFGFMSGKIGFERFTEKSIIAIRIAQSESRRLKHNFVGTEQLLIGLIGEGSGFASQFLTSVGVNLENAKIEEEKIIGRGNGYTAINIPFTPRAKQALELALEESRQLGVKYIGTEHLLLGLLKEGARGTGGGVAIKILQNLGVDVVALEERLRAGLT